MPSPAGTILIVVAPSGAGKTSLVRALMDARSQIRHSVSCTTRAPRDGERDGEDYCFITPAEFRQRRLAGEFLEWAEVHGNLYGTSRQWIDAQTAAGADIVLEIDWQGARQVRGLYPRRFPSSLRRRRWKSCSSGWRLAAKTPQSRSSAASPPPETSSPMPASSNI
jgi:guanylate kinase